MDPKEQQAIAIRDRSWADAGQMLDEFEALGEKMSSAVDALQSGETLDLPLSKRDIELIYKCLGMVIGDLYMRRSGTIV